MKSPKDVYTRMVEAWPAPGFVRSDTGKFTFGILPPRTLANIACQGKGPPSQKIGKKVWYDKHDFAAWMRKRDTGEA